MPESGIKIDRVSIPYHVPSPGSSHVEGNFFSDMFIEDIAEDLFPTDGMVDHMPVFRLSSDDEHVLRVIQSAFVHSANYGGFAEPRNLLSFRLSAFGNQTARRLLVSGAVAFEIAAMVDANNNNVGFSVPRVDGVRSFAGFTWQTIPRNALACATRENPPRVNRRRVQIPRDQLVYIRLPTEYKRIPSDLRALRHTGSVFPKYFNPEMSRKGAEELWKIEQRAVASITRSTGWHGRWTFNEVVTSYYMIRRLLRFEEFKVNLREAVVDGINRILAVAEATVGFRAEVRLHHLPTLEEIAGSRDDLAAGRLGLDQVMDQYSINMRGRLASLE